VDRGSHRPVRAEGKHGTAVQQTSPSITELQALGPEALFCKAAIVDGVIRLHRGNDAERRKPPKIRPPQMLHVLDAETPVGGPVFPFCALQQIEYRMYCPVADRMDGDL
jgi:hypothetical protein